MPEVEGRIPVIRLARDGLHAGAEQWALVKSTPLLARRSRFGVLTSGCPPRQPTQSFKSSIAIKSTFGLFLAEMAENTIFDKENVAAPAAVNFRNLRRLINFCPLQFLVVSCRQLPNLIYRELGKESKNC